MGKMIAKICIASGLMAIAAVAPAQAVLPGSVPAPVQNVVQLSASAQKEAQQDWLTAVLVTRQQAADAGTAQNRLKATLEGALAQARAQARDGQVEISTGAFSVYPRYGRDGQVQGWDGTAELLVQGRDVAQVAALAGRVPGMVVSQMRFSLSRELSQKLEADVRHEAVANFRAAAQQLAHDFGFSAYQLREVNVSTAGEGPVVRARAMAAMVQPALSDAPVPAEPGKGSVQVTVTGSVQLTP